LKTDVNVPSKSNKQKHLKKKVCLLTEFWIRIRILIRIRKDPHHFGNLDPDPHQFADVKPKCMKYEPILALFQGLEPFCEARISGSASGL
jgi:hypothetical protein